MKRMLELSRPPSLIIMSRSPSRRVLVLHDQADPSATWLRDEFARDSDIVADFISGEELFGAACIAHEVNSRDSTFRLQFGRVRLITHRDFSFVINRLTYPAQFLRTVIHAEDLSYVIGELSALYVSILSSFSCPVMNLPSGGGLYGTWRGDVDWALLAAQCGLSPRRPILTRSTDNRLPTGPRVPLVTSDVASLVLFEDGVYGRAAPPGLATRLKDFRHRSECQLLGVAFAVQPDGDWTYLYTQWSPDLRIGGQPLGSALLSRAKGAGS